MEDQKMDNLLNLALDSTENERIRSGNLNGGSTGEAGVWDVVVKYSGNPEALAGEDVRAVPLLGGYAVVTLPPESLEEYARRPEISPASLPYPAYRVPSRRFRCGNCPYQSPCGECTGYRSRQYTCCHRCRRTSGTGDGTAHSPACRRGGRPTSGATTDARRSRDMRPVPLPDRHIRCRPTRRCSIYCWPYRAFPEASRMPDRCCPS